MKTFSTLWRFHARTLLVALAGWGMALVRVSAADEPAAAPAAPAAPKPPAVAGTWFVFSPPTNAEEVLASSLRIKMLSLAKGFLVREMPDLRTRLLAVENPYYAKQPPPPEPVVAVNAGGASTAPTVPTQPAAPAKLSDEEKLKAVGEKLQPTGILEAGNRRVVTFAGNGGGTIDVGMSFSSTVPPDTAPISIQMADANDNSCTLKLNSTTVTVNYVLKPSVASHAPTPSSSTTPSQPKP